MACPVKGCVLTDAAHRRMYDHIEETVGRMAADEFDYEHSERDPIEVYGTPEHEAWLIEMEQREG